MAVYYVDDGGSDTAPFDTWAKAATSLSKLDDDVALASGDIVYIGHDHVCQYTHSAHRTIVGPTSGAPTVIISATQGSDPPAYQASSTKQIDTTEGAYQLVFDGCFALIGISMSAGSSIEFRPDHDETMQLTNCIVAPPANGNIFLTANCFCTDLTVDLTADGTTNRSSYVFGFGGSSSISAIRGLNFINLAYRTGYVFSHTSSSAYGNLSVSGADFSGGTQLSAIFQSGGACEFICNNALTHSTWVPSTDHDANGRTIVTNTGSADSPSYLYVTQREGSLISTSSIYRSGGASFETVNVAWLVKTANSCVEISHLWSPYIYGYIDTAGTKTFDLYITNDTADFTDAEVWLEVEYLGTADGAKWERATDQRATITTTAAAQDDDTTSTWVGTGPSFTYKQRLSVTAAVAEEGQFRALVCVGVASIASSRYFYVDPAVFVS